MTPHQLAFDSGPVGSDGMPKCTMGYNNSRGSMGSNGSMDSRGSIGSRGF